MANLGPVLFLALRRRQRGGPSVASAIWLVLGCSFLSMLGLSLLWDRPVTVPPSPDSHSQGATPTGAEAR